MGNHEHSTGPVLMAFVVGAIAGAAVALLYAPASGEETRRKLAERAREGRERAEELTRDGREFLDRQGATVTEAVEHGREAFDRARKESL